MLKYPFIIFIQLDIPEEDNITIQLELQSTPNEMLACLESSIVKIDNKSIEYRERFVEDFPFCEPFKCPYWVDAASQETINSECFTKLSECMPTGCQLFFYMTLAMDVVIVCVIILFNVAIIVIRYKTTVLRNSYG